MNNSHISILFLIIIVGSSNKISSQNRKTLPVFIRDWMHTLYCPKNGSPERRPSKFDRCPTRTKLAHQSNLPLESGSRIDEQCQHSGERTQMMQWKFFYLSVRSCPPNRLGADGNNLRAPHTTRVDSIGRWGTRTDTTQLIWRPTLMRQQARGDGHHLCRRHFLADNGAAAFLCAFQSMLYLNRSCGLHVFLVKHWRDNQNRQKRDTKQMTTKARLCPIAV